MTNPTLYHATFEYAGEWDYVFLVEDSSIPYGELKLKAIQAGADMHDDDLETFTADYGDSFNVFKLDEIDGYKITLNK